MPKKPLLPFARPLANSSPFLRALSAGLLAMLFLVAAPAVLSAETSTSVDYGDLTISGRVLDPDGSGLAGAKVRFEPMRPLYERLRAYDVDSTAERSRSKRTDDDGFFSWQAPEPGAYRVFVEAEGFREQRFTVRALVQPVVLPPAQLRRVAPLKITVQGEDGPLAGARVLVTSRRNGHEVFQGPGSALGTWDAPPEIAETDERGLAVLSPGVDEAHLLYVAAPGHVPQRIHVEDASPVKARLVPGKSRQFRLVEADGRPLTNALLLLAGSALKLAETDENGEAELFLTPEGKLTFDWAAADGRWASLTLVDEGEGIDTATVPAPVDVHGQVRTEDGRQLGNVLVVPTFDPGAATSTDSEGKFQVRLSRAGDYALTAAAPGWKGPSMARLSAADLTPTLTLTPAAAVSGRVLDEAGEPVPFVEIRASARGAEPWDRERTRGTVSDSRGAYYLAIPFPEETWEIMAQKDGYATGTAQVPPFEPPASARRLDITLPTGHQVFGEVVDVSDAPVIAARVELVEEPQAGDMGRYFASMTDGRLRKHTALTDKEGRFATGGLDSDKTYRLTARAGGFAPTTVPGIALEDGVGEVDLGQVVLVPGARVEGTVVDKDDRPIAGAQVEMIPTGKSFRSPDSLPTATSAADGTFEIPDLVPDEAVSLHISREGFVPLLAANVVASLDPEPLRAVMTAAVRLSGRIIGPDGSPVAHAMVSVGRPDPTGQGHRAQSSSDEQGRFQVEGAAPGPSLLVVLGKGYQPYRRSNLELTAGEPLENLEIRLERGLELTGKLTDPDGGVVQGASIHAMPVSTRNMATLSHNGSAQSDENGRFRLENLAPDTYEVTVQHPDFPNLTRTVTLEGEDRSVAWVLSRGASVAGRVVDELDGSGVAGAEVMLQSSLGQARALSKDDGSFEVRGLRPGDYVLECSKVEYAMGRLDAPLTVGAEGVDGLEIRLARGAAIVGRVVGLDFDELSAAQVIAFSDAGRAGSGIDFEGRFRLDHLAPGEWSVSAYVDGRFVVEAVTLEPGQAEATVELEFEPGSELVGRVLLRGEPLTGAEIRLMKEGDIPREGISGLDGSFRLEGLGEGDYMLFLTHRSTGLSHRDRVSLPYAGELVLDLTSTRLSGTVRDAGDGTGIPQATLVLQHPGDELRRGFFPGLSSSGRASSGADGEFSLGDFTGGTWNLRVVKEGYATYEQSVEVLPGAESLELDVRLTPTSATRIRILDTDGSVAGLTRIAVLDADGRTIARQQVTPDADGTVQLTTAPHGTWDVLLSDEDGPVVEGRVTVPGDGGTWTLPRGGLVRVLLRGGTPTVASRVRFTDPAGRKYRELEYGGGPGPEEMPILFTTPRAVRLPPGPWRVEVVLPDGSVSEPRDVVVQDGSVQELVFESGG